MYQLYPIDVGIPSVDSPLACINFIDKGVRFTSTFNKCPIFNCFLSRTLVERARVECQNHWFVYNERMSVESCAQAVSNLAIQFGDSDDDSGTAMSRPFGVAVMFAGKKHYSI